MTITRSHLICMLLLPCMLGCSILPQAQYTPINRYDFGPLPLHAPEQMYLSTDDIRITLQGPHPTKWCFRTGVHQIERMEYQRWSPSLPTLLTTQLAAHIKKYPLKEDLKINIYSWEYNETTAMVTTEFSIANSAHAGIILTETEKTTSAIPSDIAAAFSRLSLKFSTRISSLIQP